MRNIAYIAGLCFALACSSCDRDRLYYATEEQGFVRLNVNWQPAQLEPNGISVYVFDRENGKAVGKCRVCSDPNTIDIALPVGKFDLLLVNNTEEELAAINFTDIDNLSTFKACLAANEEPLYSSLLSKAEGTARSAYLTECDILASALAREIEITPRDIHYFKEKPAAGTHEISRTVEVTPERRTELIDIEIKVTNITSTAGAPRTHLTAMCEGVNLETASKYGNNVTHEFVLNNKRVDPDNYKVGTISKKLIAFGPEQENDACVNRHQLIMHFVLVNGETHTVTLNVHDLIETSHDGTQRVHKIRAEITLPEAIGNGEGVFDPDIEEWEEIETELPI